ncbi:hypothetical protein JCM19232_5223 [Vibrio ishigakensis]|uniref:Uncharacterized protein n=1 Tax=Vibrio ishigakensis TaxID=1481914 RepID=A0A0B8PHJ8_9VIBR|nr:hypothetical protein JCM19232_5223 [Vibrio ishigakensis]
MSLLLYSIASTEINSYSLMLGTTGPNSYAEEGQKFVHSIIKSDDPQGWDNQIENQVVLNFTYNRNDKWYESALSGTTNHESVLRLALWQVTFEVRLQAALSGVGVQV